MRTVEFGLDSRPVVPTTPLAASPGQCCDQAARTDCAHSVAEHLHEVKRPSAVECHSKGACDLGIARADAGATGSSCHDFKMTRGDRLNVFPRQRQ